MCGGVQTMLWTGTIWPHLIQLGAASCCQFNAPLYLPGCLGGGRGARLGAEAWHHGDRSGARVKAAAIQTNLEHYREANPSCRAAVENESLPLWSHLQAARLPRISCHLAGDKLFKSLGEEYRQGTAIDTSIAFAAVCRADR